jgi:NADH:ubiquinone reductase (H+-translocating)
MARDLNYRGLSNNMAEDNNKLKKVVVVGGGFAGLNLIKKLSKDKRFSLTLVDCNNYHFFPPLLYQVSTAFIEPSNISYPFRRMFREKENVRFHMGKLKNVNTHLNTIETDSGILPYDYLVLAVGTESNYFGLENIERSSLPMKTIDEALNLRNTLLLNMEQATRAETPEERNRLLNVVIAGGGPTGVELAGMLAELGKHVVEKEYPELTDWGSHIYLVNAGDTLLSPMSKKAQAEAQKILTRLGVHILLNTAVKDFSGGKVLLSDDSVIEAASLIWTSGVIGREVSGLPKEAAGHARRLMVDGVNLVNGTNNIFAIGDICLQTTDLRYPKGHPQVAQVAIQGGEKLAHNLIRMMDGRQMVPFRYHDKGTMAIISKYKAVADLPRFSFTGFFAWFIWLFIHIMPLVGFSNKVKLAFNWFWSFISNNPTLRLIIRPGVKNEKQVDRVE